MRRTFARNVSAVLAGKLRRAWIFADYRPCIRYIIPGNAGPVIAVIDIQPHVGGMRQALCQHPRRVRRIDQQAKMDRRRQPVIASISRQFTEKAMVISFQPASTKYSAIMTEETVIAWTPASRNHAPICADWCVLKWRTKPDMARTRLVGHPLDVTAAPGFVEQQRGPRNLAQEICCRLHHSTSVWIDG